jgi:SecD/SecF fusion protein
MKLARLLFPCLATLMLAGCSKYAGSAVLSKAPDHGASYLIQYDAAKVAADTNALANLKVEMAKRFAKLGVGFFWEPVSTNQVRIVAAVGGDDHVTAVRNMIAHPGLLELRLVNERSRELISDGQSEPGYELVRQQRNMPSGPPQITPYLVKIKPELAGHSIESAFVNRGPQGQPEIEFELTADASKAFATITTDNKGKQLAIVLDGDLMSAPVINEPILDGRGVVSSDFTDQEALMLANVLETPLPFPIKVTLEKTF